MVFAYLRTIKDGACSKWIQNSKWAKYLIAVSVICGGLAGVGIADVASTYSSVSQPKIVHIDSVEIQQDTRELTSTITTSFPDRCDRVTYHTLRAKIGGEYNSYNLPPSIGGPNFTLSSKSYTVHMKLPTTIPTGDYEYTVRTLYFCNAYGLTLFYPAETTPIKIHLN